MGRRRRGRAEKVKPLRHGNVKSILALTSEEGYVVYPIFKTAEFIYFDYAGNQFNCEKARVQRVDLDKILPSEAVARRMLNINDENWGKLKANSSSFIRNARESVLKLPYWNVHWIGDLSEAKCNEFNKKLEAILSFYHCDLNQIADVKGITYDALAATWTRWTTVVREEFFKVEDASVVSFPKVGRNTFDVSFGSLNKDRLCKARIQSGSFTDAIFEEGEKKISYAFKCPTCGFPVIFNKNNDWKCSGVCRADFRMIEQDGINGIFYQFHNQETTKAATCASCLINRLSLCKSASGYNGLTCEEYVSEDSKTTAKLDEIALMLPTQGDILDFGNKRDEASETDVSEKA